MADEPAETPDLPLAPAAGSVAMLWTRLIASIAVFSVWPPGFVRQMIQSANNLFARPRAVRNASGYDQRVRYSLPFEGEWYVYKGGPDKPSSHSWGMVGQRFAYDFVIADPARRRWRADSGGRELTDYLCYGAPILAPAEGIVVEVRDGVKDAGRPGTGWLDPFTKDITGNHVVIEHAEGEYSLLAHLAPGSVEVGEGDTVGRGQVVGACGNSGNSGEPHLHFQVQDRRRWLSSAGLPVSFDGVSVDGDAPGDDRYLRGGTLVAQRA